MLAGHNIVGASVGFARNDSDLLAVFDHNNHSRVGRSADSRLCKSGRALSISNDLGTIWALFLSFYSASRMLALSEQRDVRNHHRTASVAAVVNVMVVFLYWRLFFEDPALVNGNGDIVWHQQYYLHGLGPALQIFDALFIARVFGRPLRAVGPFFDAIDTTWQTDDKALSDGAGMFSTSGRRGT